MAWRSRKPLGSRISYTVFAGVTKFAGTCSGAPSHIRQISPRTCPTLGGDSLTTCLPRTCQMAYMAAFMSSTTRRTPSPKKDTLVCGPSRRSWKILYGQVLGNQSKFSSPLIRTTRPPLACLQRPIHCHLRLLPRRCLHL